MRFFVLTLCTVAALVWQGTKVVAARQQEVQRGFEIADATSEQHRLEEELRKLRIDRAALLDPKRLEQAALADGLRVPAPDQVVVVPQATPKEAPKKAKGGTHGR